jgi:hypothetical protein
MTNAKKEGRKRMKRRRRGGEEGKEKWKKTDEWEADLKWMPPSFLKTSCKFGQILSTSSILFHWSPCVFYILFACAFTCVFYVTLCPSI